MERQQLVIDFSKLLQNGEIKVTKEYLKGFIKAKEDYEIAKNTYEYLLASKPTVMNLGKVKGSDKNFPYFERNFVIDGVDERAVSRYEKELEQSKKEMVEKRNTYNDMKMDIELFIIKIPDENHRDIFRMIYIENKKGAEVARIKGYTPPRISQIIKEYIE